MRELLPLIPDYIELFVKLSKENTNFTIKENILYEKLIKIFEIIPDGLLGLGIVIKTINDEHRPSFDQASILRNLKSKVCMSDFITLTINSITYAKIECTSANYGQLDYKCRPELKIKHDALAYNIKLNLNINRLFHIREKNYSKLIDTFNFSLKNVIENAFYVFSIRNLTTNNQTRLKVGRPNESLLFINPDLLANKKNVVDVNLLIPSDLIDLHDPVEMKHDDSKKILLKFQSKILIPIYMQDDIPYSKVLNTIKDKLLEYIGESVENILKDKYLNIDASTLFSFDYDNKSYINYQDSIMFVFDQEKMPYTVTYD